MEDLPLACLYCADPAPDDGGDYCSSTCADKHSAEQDIRRAGGSPLTCKECGGLFSSRRVGSGRPRSSYCSAECGTRAAASRVRERKLAARPMVECPVCGATFVQVRVDKRFCTARCGDIHRGQRLPEPLPRRVCALPECDVEFQPRRRIERCCSERHGRLLCNRRWKLINPEPWNDARRDRHHRRRALKKAASTGDPVVFSEIAERDAWRCGLCGEDVPQQSWPHPLSPSLDHVLPLTRGGAHDPSNVQLAHLVCNTRKGNRVAA